MNVFTLTLSGQQNHSGGIGHSLKHKFKEGDLVSWKKLGTGEKTYATITKIVYRTFFNNRVFYTAKIMTSDGDMKEINLGLLKLESKANIEE
jgi:hypothetical protein